MKNLKQLAFKKRHPFLLLFIIILILSALPQVYNPSPVYETKLEYGKELPLHIQNILTPKEKPKRIIYE